MLAVHTIELGEIPVYGTFDGCHSWREPMLVNFFSQWFTALNLLPSSATEATLRRFRLRLRDDRTLWLAERDQALCGRPCSNPSSGLQ